MPVLSKLSDNNSNLHDKQLKDKNRTNPLGVNCCVYSSDEVLDFQTIHCDKNIVNNSESALSFKDKNSEEKLTTKPNSPIIDRMLLRSSAIQLPSLVTGASGKIQIYSLICNHSGVRTCICPFLPNLICLFL